MFVYFLRHGHAEPQGERKTDAERRLDEEGKKQVKRIVKWLAGHKARVSLVVTSPYPRATATAQPVAEALGAELVEEARLASGELDLTALAEVVSALGDPTGVMVVGHEPDLSAAVSDLIGGGELELKTGGLAMVECEGLRAGSGVLRLLLSPSMMG